MAKDAKGHGSNSKGAAKAPDKRLFSGPNTRPMRGTPAQVPKGHVNIANGQGGYVTRAEAQKAIKMHEKGAALAEARSKAFAASKGGAREAKSYAQQAQYAREAADMHRKALGKK